MLRDILGGQKKRVLVVLILCLLALTIPIIILYFYLTTDIQSSNIADFQINGPVNEQSILGFGTNASNANDGNFIENNSFEPLVYRQNLIVDSGDQRKMKIGMPNDPELGVYPQDFFVGAKATVLNIDENGQRRVKKTGTVRNYLTDQIDNFYLAELPPDMPDKITWQTISNYNRKILIGGSGGNILIFNSLSDSALTRVPSRQTITGIIPYNETFLALDIAGNIFELDTEQNWIFIYSVEQLKLTEKTKHSTLTENSEIIYTNNQNQDDENSEESSDRIDFSNPGISWLSAASKRDSNGNWQYMLVGENGHYVFADNEIVLHDQIEDAKNINAVISNDSGFYLVGDDNFASFTNNGKNFRILEFPVTADWQTISSRGKEILFAGNQGQVVISNDGLVYKSLANKDFREISLRHSTSSKDHTLVFNPNFISGCILSNEQLLLADDQGLLYYSDNKGADWIDGDIFLDGVQANLDLDNQDENQINLIQRITSGQLIATNTNGQVFYALMGLSVELNDALENGVYQNGDLIQIEQLSEEPIFEINQKNPKNLLGEWFVSDCQAVEVQTYERAPGQGRGALKIDLSNSNNPVDELCGIYSDNIKQIDKTNDFTILQDLDISLSEQINTERVFNYELWAKSDQKVEINLSFANLNIGLEPVTDTIEGDWKKYHGVIVVPKNSVTEDTIPAFKMSFIGEGNVYLDNISVKPASHNLSEFHATLDEKIVGGSIIRMDFVKIGDGRYPSESWLDSNTSQSFFYQEENEIELLDQNNLVKSMEYCKTLRSNPWLVINSQANNLELKHLMQYLFGSESETYGELRLEHGAINRYNDVFDQIYFEINDSHGILVNDMQKKSYVDWVVNTLKETPEYSQIKNKLIFVDGMEYKDNVFTSNADFHASDLTLSETINNFSDYEDYENSLYELFPRDINKSINARSEFIRSMQLKNNDLRLADLIISSLSMLGEGKDATLLDINLSQMDLEDDFASCFFELGKLLHGKNLLSVDSKLEQDKVCAFAYGKNSEVVIVLINISDETVNTQISNMDLEGFVELEYDAKGNLIGDNEIKNNIKLHSVLPGYVKILYGETNGQ